MDAENRVGNRNRLPAPKVRAARDQIWVRGDADYQIQVPEPVPGTAGGQPPSPDAQNGAIPDTGWNTHLEPLPARAQAASGAVGALVVDYQTGTSADLAGHARAHNRIAVET
jgi:hypothetical protein